MAILYKLTNKFGQTRNNTQWGPGTSHETNGEGELCGPGWLHAYSCPLLAVLLNPMHADFDNPLLWEAEGEIGKTDRGLKVGCKKLTTIRQIPLPKVSKNNCIAFAILCAKTVYKDNDWNVWADNWLNGKDRAAAAAVDAARAAWAAVGAAAMEAAMEAAAMEAARAARAAREASRASAMEVERAAAVDAARAAWAAVEAMEVERAAAMEAARAAREASRASAREVERAAAVDAACAAWAAVEAMEEINLPELAKQAMQY